MKDPTRAPGAEKFIVIEWTTVPHQSENIPDIKPDDEIDFTTLMRMYEQDKIFPWGAFEIDSKADLIPELLANIRRRIVDSGLSVRDEHNRYRFNYVNSEVLDEIEGYGLSKKCKSICIEILNSLLRTNKQLEVTSIKDTVGFIVIKDFHTHWYSGKGDWGAIIREYIDGSTLDCITVISAKSLSDACGMRSKLIRQIALLVKNGHAWRYHDIVAEENNIILAPFRVFGDDPENIEDASGDYTAIRAEAGAGGDPADKLKDLPEKKSVSKSKLEARGTPTQKDQKNFDCMIKKFGETKGIKKDKIYTNTFAKAGKEANKSNYSTVAERSPIIGETEDYYYGRDPDGKYWIKGKARTAPYWILRIPLS